MLMHELLALHPLLKLMIAVFASLIAPVLLGNFIYNTFWKES